MPPGTGDQLPLDFRSCAACRAGRRHGPDHDRGCSERWLTRGEEFDESSAEEQAACFRLAVEYGWTKATTVEEYGATLYRPRRKKWP